MFLNMPLRLHPKPIFQPDTIKRYAKEGLSPKATLGIMKTMDEQRISTMRRNHAQFQDYNQIL